MKILNTKFADELFQQLSSHQTIQRVHANNKMYDTVCQLTDATNFESLT